MPWRSLPKREEGCGLITRLTPRAILLRTHGRRGLHGSAVCWETVTLQRPFKFTPTRMPAWFLPRGYNRLSVCTFGQTRSRMPA